MAPPGWEEAILEIAKDAVSIASVPVLGVAFCTVLEQRIKELSARRVNQFVDDLKIYLKGMPLRILESENFIIATAMVMRTIAIERSESKRKRFSELYRVFIHRSDEKFEKVPIEELEIWLSAAKILSDNAICILMLMKEVGLTVLFLKKSVFVENSHKFHEQLQSTCGERYANRFLAELESTGLVAQSSGRWGGNIPYVTDAGLDFLGWLSHDVN